jgi:hypothetical protein
MNSIVKYYLLNGRVRIILDNFSKASQAQTNSLEKYYLLNGRV